MSRVPENLRIDTWESRATLKYFPLRLHEKLHNTANVEISSSSVFSNQDLIHVFSELLQVLHRMRVSFGFTLYNHCILGVNNVLFQWLLYDGWRLSHCRRAGRNNHLLTFNSRKMDRFQVIQSPSRGTSRAQTLCQRSSSSAGSTRVPIFTAHLVQ